MKCLFSELEKQVKEFPYFYIYLNKMYLIFI